MKKVQFLKKLYLRDINNRQSRPAQILLTDCVSCLNSFVSVRLSEDSLPGTVYALCPYFVLLCRQKDLEEASSAYKNIDEVMANQSDLTRIVTALEPIAVIKGV